MLSFAKRLVLNACRSRQGRSLQEHNSLNQGKGIVPTSRGSGVQPVGDNGESVGLLCQFPGVVVWE